MSFFSTIRPASPAQLREIAQSAGDSQKMIIKEIKRRLKADFNFGWIARGNAASHIFASYRDEKLAEKCAKAANDVQGFWVRKPQGAAFVITIRQDYTYEYAAYFHGSVFIPPDGRGVIGTGPTQRKESGVFAVYAHSTKPGVFELHLYGTGGTWSPMTFDGFMIRDFGNIFLREGETKP